MPCENLYLISHYTMDIKLSLTFLSCVHMTTLIIKVKVPFLKNLENIKYKVLAGLSDQPLRVRIKVRVKCAMLEETYPNRLMAIIKANGDSIKY